MLRNKKTTTQGAFFAKIPVSIISIIRIRNIYMFMRIINIYLLNDELR